MALLFFWFSIFILFYGFLGYPIILKILTRFIPLRNKIYEEAQLPTVSIILSVYNEENVIADKLVNYSELDYPKSLLELVIISDDSTDRTDTIIQTYQDESIEFIQQKKRCGKTLNINKGVSVAKGEIIVFTDANSMYARDAIDNLVHHFNIPEIGLVSGHSIYVDSINNKIALGGIYRAYEESMKKDESLIGSIIGADGAIYAIRKELYEPIKPEYINDLVHPVQVVLKGYKAISEPTAFCVEEIDSSMKGEFQRQTRISAQSWLIYLRYIGKMIKNGKYIFAWEFTSHKVIRWLALPILSILFVSALASFEEGLLHRSIVVLFLGFMGMVVIGKRMKGAASIAYLTFLVYTASILGLYRCLAGDIAVTWKPRE